MTRPLRVAAEPAFRTRHANPYNARLYESLLAAGVSVREFSYVRLFLSPPDVVHLHWPELTFLSSHRRSVVIARIGLFSAGLALARLRGTRLVWTVHNLAPHERRWSPAFTRRFWRRFFRQVDAVLVLSSGAAGSLRARVPELSAAPVFVTPHGHYREAYDLSGSRSDARSLLGLPASARVVAFVGQVRGYKNVPALVRALRDVEDPDLVLVVAGAASDATVAAELRSLARADRRVRLDLEFQPDDRLAACLRAADLVVLPFTAILNSGSALLALSADRPVLVPALGALGELGAAVGPEWVRTYSGELTAGTLADALGWALRDGRPERAPLDALGWDVVAGQTLAAYSAVVRAPGRRGLRRLLRPA